MSFVVEAVIVSVGHDDVVDESDVHGLCGTLHDLGQVKVVVAGAYIPRRMVVYQSYLGGPADERFTQDGADIGCGLVDTSATDTYFVYDFPRLIEQQNPEFLGGQVAKQGMEQVVDVC